MDKKTLIRDFRAQMISKYGTSAENMVNRKILQLMNTSSVEKEESDKLKSELNDVIKRVNKEKLNSKTTMKVRKKNLFKLPKVISQKNVNHILNSHLNFLTN